MKQLICAVKNQDIKEVKKLIEAGADIQKKDKYGYTPLHLACHHGSKDIAKLLLDAGADIEAENILGHTPIDTAIYTTEEEEDENIYTAKKEIAKLLIDRGADVKDPLRLNKDKEYTLLHHASRRSDEKTAKLLIEAGVPVDAKDIYGSTPLRVACEEGDKDMVQLLIDAGADVNAKDRWGSFLPLQRVIACRRDVLIAKLLIDAGADVDAKDKDKNTLLHHAVLENNIEIAILLLKAGANPNKKNKWRETPLDITEEEEDRFFKLPLSREERRIRDKISILLANFC